MTRLLLFILILGLILRLWLGLSLDPSVPYVADSADARFYLQHGDALVSGAVIPGVDVSVLSQPPVYFMFVGLPRILFSPEGTVIAVRVMQAILSTATAYFVYRMARQVGLHGERVGIIAAALVALNPIFILESAQILTETVYVFFISAGLAVYIDSLTPVSIRSTPPLQMERELGGEVRFMLLAGALFGLATLTRAVLLLFPLGLAIHLLIVYRGRAWKMIAALLVAYALVISTWTIYNLARWNRFVIAGEGLPAFLYIGAAGWADPFEVDQQLNETLGEEASNDMGERQGDYLEAANMQISADPLGYVRHRVEELASAYLQPHGTTYFSGESLREVISQWLREDRSLAGIGRILNSDQFFPKLILYLFHYGVLITGVIGAWRLRRQWRLTLPLLGFIAYVTLVHLLLLALPRYIFPTMLCWIVLGTSGLTRNVLARVES